LGVVAALEVLTTLRENGIRPRVRLEAIDFTDEEGTLVGFLGSAALAGHLDPQLLQNPRGGRENLLAGMRRAGLTEEGILSAARPKGSIAAYLELHIEQGKRLERMGTDIGVVSAIVGIPPTACRSSAAPTTPARPPCMTGWMQLAGGSAFTLAARGLVMKDFPDCVVNVGAMEFKPGAFNIVPAQVDVSLEFRSADEQEFDRLDSALLALAQTEAKRFGLELRPISLAGILPRP
jgi:hypothetical protein